jgi:hypothetical protein
MSLQSTYNRPIMIVDPRDPDGQPFKDPLGQQLVVLETTHGLAITIGNALNDLITKFDDLVKKLDPFIGPDAPTKIPDPPVFTIGWSQDGTLLFIKLTSVKYLTQVLLSVDGVTQTVSDPSLSRFEVLIPFPTAFDSNTKFLPVILQYRNIYGPSIESPNKIYRFFPPPNILKTERLVKDSEFTLYFEPSPGAVVPTPTSSVDGGLEIFRYYTDPSTKKGRLIYMDFFDQIDKGHILVFRNVVPERFQIVIRYVYDASSGADQQGKSFPKDVCSQYTLPYYVFELQPPDFEFW